MSDVICFCPFVSRLLVESQNSLHHVKTEDIARITMIHPLRHNCHGWPSAEEKSLKLINTPSHSPNDGQALPCLTSIPLIILSSSLVPSYALNFLITVLYMHHNPLISDLSFCSCKPGYMLFLELYDTVLAKSTKTHSPLQTLTHNLTPPSLHVKLPLNIPIIPIVSKFHPNLSYPIYIPLENPSTSQAEGS